MIVRNGCIKHRTGLGCPPLLRDLQVGSLSPQLQDIIMPLQLGQKAPALPFAEGHDRLYGAGAPANSRFT